MIEVTKLVAYDDVPDSAESAWCVVPKEESEAWNKSHPYDPKAPCNYDDKCTWREYVEMEGIMPSVRPYYQALRRYLIKNNLRRGGFWHQDKGCPIFNDGRVLTMSFRVWGYFAAAVWNTEERHRRYNYMDFAWDTPCLHSELATWSARVARDKEYEREYGDIMHSHASHARKLMSKHSVHYHRTRSDAVGAIESKMDRFNREQEARWKAIGDDV